METIAEQMIAARVVPGHRVASGLNGNPRFPGGTLRMQAPHFLARGLDLSHLYSGTVNVSIAPFGYRVVKARHTFSKVKWHPIEPAEDFSFFDVRLVRPHEAAIAGFIYFPHPDTKPEHFQQPDVLELLLPFVGGLHYGAEITLQIPATQMVFELPSAKSRCESAADRQQSGRI
ncbi:MAG: hypothetical protein QM813_00545 [Verrucomicrobiota bacterium]